jgi:hypothetical protein
MRTLIASIGDCHPIQHSGGLVYRCTGKHRGSAEYELDLLIAGHNDTVPLEIGTVNLDTKGDHKEWFEDKLPEVASFIGSSVEEMMADWTSGDPYRMAFFYSSLVDYFGIDNFGGIHWSESEGKARFKYSRTFNAARKRGIEVWI